MDQTIKTTHLPFFLQVKNEAVQMKYFLKMKPSHYLVCCTSTRWGKKKACNQLDTLMRDGAVFPHHFSQQKRSVRSDLDLSPQLYTGI